MSPILFYLFAFLFLAYRIKNQSMILQHRPIYKEYAHIFVDDQTSDQSCIQPISNTQDVIGLGNCYYFGLYYVTLGIGTPPQYFNVQFDTGSDVLWVPTTATNPIGFNETASATFKIEKSTQNISYESNSYVYGNNGHDYVTLQGTSINSSCPILFASKVVNFSYPPNVVGIAGMGFNNDQSFIDVAFSQGVIKTSTFTLALRNPNQSSIMYYNVIPEQIINNTLFSPVLGYDTLYWQVSLIGFFVGSTDWTSYAAEVAVIDSGTTLFYLNPTLQQQFVDSYLPKTQCNSTNGLIICNSTIVSSLPSLTFMFPGVAVFLQVDDYVQCFNETCYVHIYTVDTTPAEVLLGDTLFLEYNITFDKLNQKVGFMGNTEEVVILGDQNFQLSQYIMIGIQCLLVIAIITGFFVLPHGTSTTNENYKMKQNLFSSSSDRRPTQLTQKFSKQAF